MDFDHSYFFRFVNLIQYVQSMRKWIPLFTTNLLSVFNDNLLKNLICFISFLWVAHSQENKSLIISIASALFVIPYILFSPYAGILAKRISKAKIIVIAKIIEIPIMIIAVAGFYMESVYLVMIALFLMGLQSAMFSPSKYGLIRDIGGEEGISFGTGTMELITFFAVNVGFFAAGRLSDLDAYREHYIASILIIVAAVGYFVSRFIKANEPAPERDFKDTVNPISFIARSYKWGKTNTKGLNWVVLSLSTFWLIGSMIQMNLYVYCEEYLAMSNAAIGDVLALMGIGIGVGCFLAGLFSGKQVMVTLIPLGNIGLSLFLTLIFVMEPSQWMFTVFLVLAAVFSGFYKIPLNAWIQANIKGRKLGEMIAYNNLMVFVFLLISAGLFGFVSGFIDSRGVFLVIAVISWIIGGVMFFTIPGIRSGLGKRSKTT